MLSTNVGIGGGGAVQLIPRLITISDVNIMQTVLVGGIATGEIVIERGNLPPEITWEITGNSIAFTGSRSSEYVSGQFRVRINRGGRSSQLTITVNLSPQEAMGFEWDFSNPSPSLLRLGGAAGLTATAGIGTVAGYSDFDKMPIYEGIRRCNLRQSNGSIAAWEGEPEFAFAPPLGIDVMTRIPKFYYRVEVEGTRYRYWVSPVPADGFLLHPAFARPGGNLEEFYIGSYEAMRTVGTGAVLRSISGVAPLVNHSRTNSRIDVRLKGAGWQIQDFAARVAVTTLMIVEFANLNTQSVIAPGNTSSTTSLHTGRTNNIVGTGREAGTANQVSFVWRGIESWWGNVWEWVDGVNRNGAALWVSTNPAHFADGTSTNHTQLDFAIPSTSGFLTRLGFDANNSWAAFPNVATGGSETTFLCDNGWFTGAGWRAARVGGAWGDAGQAGAFAWAVSDAAAATNVGIGTRLMYLPQ